MKIFKQAEKGFTLIELLVVILIIGILAAIAVPQYFKVVEKSRASELGANYDAIRGSEERYMAQNSQYYSGALTSGCSLDLCTGGAYTPLTNFTTPAIAAAGSNGNGWSWAPVRTPAASGFGGYTVTFTVSSGVSPTCAISNCSDGTACGVDLAWPSFCH